MAANRSVVIAVLISAIVILFALLVVQFIMLRKEKPNKFIILGLSGGICFSASLITFMTLILS